MVDHRAFEIEECSGKCGIRRHRGSQARDEVAGHGGKIDAKNLSVEHDGSAGDNQFPDMVRFGTCKQEIARIEVVTQTIVVDRVPIEQENIRWLTRGEAPAIILVHDRQSAVMHCHSQHGGAVHGGHKPGATVQEMSEP